MAPPVALLTNDGLPLPIGLCDLIGTAHLAEGHAADDEDHDTWPSAVLSRCLILVPVAVPSTAGAERKSGSHYNFIARCFPSLGILIFFFTSSLTTIFCELRMNSKIWTMFHGHKDVNVLFIQGHNFSGRRRSFSKSYFSPTHFKLV